MVDENSGKLITNLGDVTALGNYKKLVDCVDGICKQTAGYVKGSSDMFKFVDEEDGDVEDTLKVNAGTACAGAVGKFIEGNSGVCIKSANGGDVAFAYDSTIKHLILKSATGVADSPFRDTENDILVKHASNYFIIDKFDAGII